MREPQTDHPVHDPVLPRPLRRQRAGRFAARVAGGLMLGLFIAMLGLAAAAVWFTERSVPAPRWLLAAVEERAGTTLEGGALRFGAVSATLDAQWRPAIRMQDVELTDGQGRTLANLRALEVELSLASVLARAPQPRRIGISGAVLRLRRAADGRLDLALGDSGSTLGSAPDIAALLEGIDAIFAAPSLAALEVFDAGSLTLRYVDARSGRAWTFDGGRLRLVRNGRGLRITTDAALLGGGDDVTTVEASYERLRGSREAVLAARVRDAPAADIAAQSAALSWLGVLDAPISAAFRGSVASDGSVGPVSVALEIGVGAVAPIEATRPIRFSAAKAYFSYDPETARIAFDEVTAESDWGSLRSSGHAYLIDVREGLPEAILAQFDIAELNANPAGLYDSPLAFRSGRIDARLRLDPFTLTLGEAVVSKGQSRLVAEGTVRALPEGWQVALEAVVDGIDHASLMAAWPRSFRPGTRGWFDANIAAAEYFDLQGAVRYVPGQPLRRHLGFEFRDAEFRVVPGMPPVEEAAGVVRFEDERGTIMLDAGRVRPPEGGALSLAGSVLSLPDMRIRPAPAEITLQTAGPIRATLSLVDQPPLRLLSRAGRTPDMAEGQAILTTRLALPLREKLGRDDIAYEVTGRLAAVRSASLVEGREITATELALGIDPTLVSISGKAALDGLPVAGTWSRALGEGASGSRFAGSVELSPRFAETFGISLPGTRFDGAGAADIEIRLAPERPAEITLASDLAGLAIDAAPLGWRKPAEAEGRLFVEATLGAAPEVSRLEFSSPGLEVEGTVAMREGGGLALARFSRFRAGEWIDAALSVEGRGEGVPPAIGVSGGRIDLSRLPPRERSGAGPGAGPGDGPLTVRLDRLQVAEGIALTGFAGRFDGGIGLDGSFIARVNEGAEVSGRVVPGPRGPSVRLASADAGGVLASAGVFRQARGGQLELTLVPAREGRGYTGELAVRDTRVRDAPVIASLLSAVSVVGLLEQLDGGGLFFSEVDARFGLTPERITLVQASAVGPSLGISLDGYFDPLTREMDLQGVLSPLYLFNVIGSVLTRKGEGLIGFNFTIRGPADGPRVGVNPLSAFTPGMFREIFRRPPPEVGQ